MYAWQKARCFCGLILTIFAFYYINTQWQMRQLIQFLMLIICQMTWWTNEMCCRFSLQFSFLFFSIYFRNEMRWKKAQEPTGIIKSPWFIVSKIVMLIALGRGGGFTNCDGSAHFGLISGVGRSRSGRVWTSSCLISIMFYRLRAIQIARNRISHQMRFDVPKLWLFHLDLLMMNPGRISCAHVQSRNLSVERWEPQ